MTASSTSDGLRRGLGAGTLLLALMGCGSGGEAPPSVQRPRLDSTQVLPREERVVARLAPTESEWRVEAPEVEWTVPDGEPVLHLRGGEAHTVELDASVPTGAFQIVRVRVAAEEELSLRCGLLGDDAPLAVASRFAYAAPGRVSELEFEFPACLRLDGPPGQLHFAAKGERLDWSLLSVELVERPLAGWLPAFDAPGGVSLGTECRRAVGLVEGADLSGRCVVPRGGKLQVAACMPPRLVGAGAAAELHIEVSAGGGEPKIHQTLELAAEPSWFEVEIALDELEGREVELRYSLHGGGARPLACALAEPLVSTRGEHAPAVLLITSDTHRGDHVNTLEHTDRVLTPTLDALAARGVRFTDCFSTANITLPSHAALLTGTHPRDTGLIDNKSRLDEAAPTLAESFHSAGFRTFAVVGAWHLRPEWSGFDQGFERMTWPRERDSEAAERIAALEDWLPEAEGQPLFVWLHLYDAHAPYTPPESFVREYYPEGRDPRVGEGGFPAPKGDEEVRDLEYVLAQYKGEVSSLDQELARLVEGPRFRRGIVALTADHGESLGQHGIWWDHVGLYPEILHVPLLLAWPGAPSGVEVAHRVRQFDLGRTLLNLADLGGVPFPGHDLREALEEASPAPRFAISTSGAEASINLGRWHLILTLRERLNPSHRLPGPFELHRTELYDLEQDPACEHDLSLQEHDLARTLRARLIDWLRSAPAETWRRRAAETDEDLRVLSALGYAGSGGQGGDLFPEDCDCEACKAFDSRTDPR